MSSRAPRRTAAVGRRRLLLGGLGAALVAGGLGSRPVLAVDSLPKGFVFGRTQAGQEMRFSHLGGDRRRILLLGGQHGVPEANTVTLADGLLAYFYERPSLIPRNLGLDIVTQANPDGYLYGSRQYLSGVDPNRNWLTNDWDTDAYDSFGHFTAGLGGRAPMSEPETRYLANLILQRRPVLVINYHSAGCLVSTRQDGKSSELAALYAEAARYPFFDPTIEEPWWYPITGALDGWLADRGIADIFVELIDLENPEIEDNVAGVLAVMEHLAG